jgi:hypothetical protein
MNRTWVRPHAQEIQNKMKLWKTNWRKKCVPWSWMLLHLTPTLLKLPQISPPSQNNAKRSHYRCVSPYIQYFIIIILQMETLKPSLFTEPSTRKSFMLSFRLLLELFLWFLAEWNIRTCQNLKSIYNIRIYSTKHSIPCRHRLV